MPKIEQWAKFPAALRQHLIERMRDRSITLTDLNPRRPVAPERCSVPAIPWPLRASEQTSHVKLSVWLMALRFTGSSQRSPSVFLPETVKADPTRRQDVLYPQNLNERSRLCSLATQRSREHEPDGRKGIAFKIVVLTRHRLGSVLDVRHPTRC